MVVFLAGKITFLYNWGFKVGFETWFGFQVEFKINVVRVSKSDFKLWFAFQTRVSVSKLVFFRRGLGI